jgi:hypothetical protein
MISCLVFLLITASVDTSCRPVSTDLSHMTAVGALDVIGGRIVKLFCHTNTNGFLFCLLREAESATLALYLLQYTWSFSH